MNVGSIGQSIINGTYGSDSKPLTAYEELKAWCEKHLTPNDYKIIPDTYSYCTTVYFAEFDCTDVFGMICFTPNGSVANVGAVDADDMLEHSNEYERKNGVEYN